MKNNLAGCWSSYKIEEIIKIIWNLYLIQKEKRFIIVRQWMLIPKNFAKWRKAVEGFATDYKDKITKDVAPITYEN